MKKRPPQSLYHAVMPSAYRQKVVEVVAGAAVSDGVQVMNVEGPRAAAAEQAGYRAAVTVASERAKANETPEGGVVERGRRHGSPP